MLLRPFIASYSGVTYRAIQRALTPDRMALVARLADGPLPHDALVADNVAELCEMRVLTREGATVHLDTALFDEGNLIALRDALQPSANRLAEAVLVRGTVMAETSPLLALFLGGVIGFVQGAGRAIGATQFGDNWRTSIGRYGQSKVDFSEVCAAEGAFGPDLLNKSVERGDSRTRVTIGKLVDGYADKGPCVTITREMVQEHALTVDAIRQSVGAAYVEMQPEIAVLLTHTASGRQGVVPSRMMMHLFRYLRRLVATRLCAAGFFGDAMSTGTAVVSYDNDIESIEHMLS